MTAPTATGTPAGRRRFWIALLCIISANIGAWLFWHWKYGPKRLDLLRVESFEPGDNMVVGTRPAILWRFNLDVARDALGGDAPGMVSPSVSGKWEWKDARTLLFVPEADLPRATRVQFRILPQRLRTAEGMFMSKPFESAIRTEPLRVTSVGQVAFEDNDQYVVELRFNDRVIPADVLAKLALTGPDGAALKCRLHGEAAGQTVRVLTDPVPGANATNEDAAIVVKLKEGLAGVSGPLGLEEDFEQRVPLAKMLTARGIRASYPAQGRPEIRIQLNGEAKLEAIKQVISVEPAVRFATESNWRGLVLKGDFQANTRYAVKFAAPPAGANRKEYPRPDTLSVLMPDRQAGVWFEHDEGYLGSKGNRTVLLHAVNVAELKLNVWRVYDSNLVEWRNAQANYSWNDPTRYAQPIARKTIATNREKNTVQDFRLSLDELLPAEAARDGVCRITAEAVRNKDLRQGEAELDGLDEPDASRWGSPGTSAILTLSDIGLTAKQTRSGLTAWAVSLSTARPIPNVRVRVFSNKNQLLGEARSGEDGLATIRNIQPNEGEKPTVILADLAQVSAESRTIAAPSLLPLLPLFHVLESGSPTTAPAVTLQASSVEGLTWLDLQGGEWDLADVDVSGRPYLRQGHEAFVFTERGVYRPGETVHLRAIVRGTDAGEPKAFPVRWRIRRPDLRDYRSFVTMLDADGAAGLELKLPEDLPTGRWTADIGLPDEKRSATSHFGSTTFLVEEFVPNRIKVDLKIAGAADEGVGEAPLARHQIGDTPLAADVKADYLFGRPAAGLGVEFNARLDPIPFRPGNWSSWTIGDSANLIELPGDSVMGTVKGKNAGDVQAEEMVLDAEGKARWELDLKGILKLGAKTRPATQPASDRFMGPWRLSVSAGVHELGGRTVTAAQQIEVDALPWYIAVRGTEQATPRPNVAFNFDVAMVKGDGRRHSGDAQLEAGVYRETWNTSLVLRDGRYQYDSTRVVEPVKEKAAAEVLDMIGGRGTCAVTVASSGAYILKLRDRTTGAVTSVRFYATDGQPWDDNISRENPERLELALLPGAHPTTIPTTLPAGERKFRIGEPAQVLVRSPFPGRLLLTVETDDVLSTRVIDMSASQAVVPIEIGDACRPNGYVTATVVRAIEPNLKWRTHRAFGATRLSVDPSQQRLEMKIASPTDVRPKSPLPVQVVVVDESGRPVRGAAVVVAAVDEGILALTNFRTPDPLAFFTGRRALAVGSADLYSQLMPEVAKPDKTSAVGGDGDDTGARHLSPVKGKRVKPVSLVSDVLHTDENGMAAARLDVPEFTGTLRVMAIGYARATFGSGEKGTLVRSPLIVQSSFPRFVAPGDRFDVPLIVFNNGSAAGSATVKIELDESSPLAFADKPQRSIELGPIDLQAGAQHAMSFTLAAKEACGVAKVRLSASMGTETYEENIDLPVRPASPMMSIGGYASVSTTRPAKIVLPGGLLSGTEVVDVKVTPWPTLDLPKGLDYLERYPYGCAEQTISTCFPLVYLSDIGKQIAPGVFEERRVAEKVQGGIIRLIGMQTAEGGIAMWAGSRESWPWASVYAAHFLIEAENAGHRVPEDFRRKLLSYVRNVIDRPGDDADLFELQAYACYVLSLAGQPPRSPMNRLTEVVNGPDSKLFPESAPQRAHAKTLLAMAWLHAGRRDSALGLLPQTPPLPRKDRQFGGNIGSDVRDRAMLVSAMLSIQPDNPAIPALVQQLADAGRNRQWRSTQDAALAVMTIGRYLRQAKAQQAYETAELWQGDRKLAAVDGGKSLTMQMGRAGATVGATDLNLKELEVRIGGDAAAMAYVTWMQSGVTLAPPANQDNGMKIRRRYLDENDKPVESVRSGDAVKVELTIEATPGLENIVIEDLLPAGLEIENPRLQTTRVLQHLENGTVEVWFDPAKLDIRDDRVVLVGTMPYGGVAKYVYLARSTSPGTFTAPPVRAECMYDIGINSIFGTGKFTVKP